MKKRASQERHVLAIALECCYVLRLLYLQRALDESSYTVSCETIINKPFIFHRDTDSLRLSACMYLYRVCMNMNWRKNLFVHVAMFFVLFLFYFEDSEKKKVNIREPFAYVLQQSIRYSLNLPNTWRRKRLY